MVLGITIGFLLPGVGLSLEPLSTIFIRLIKTIVVPIIFSMLVIGIAGHGSLKSVGRMGWKSLVYFEVVTTLALIIGLIVANIVKPGVGITLNRGWGVPETALKKVTIKDALVHIFPENFFDSAAHGDILQVVVFTVIFAIALSFLSEKRKKPILDLCNSLSEAMFKYTNIIMYYAPIGVCAAIAVVTGSKGMAVLSNLGLLIFCLFLGLSIFILVVLLPIALFLKIPIRKFYSAVKEPAMIAFSTSSSEAALPKAIQAMQSIGVPRDVVAFVLPTGYSFNLDGATLYQSMALIFAAQAAGLELTLGHQLMFGVTLIFASKGTAGVPRASIVVLAGMFATFGIPVEAVAILLGVDPILEMARAAVNVIGNCMATVVIAKWEGRFGEIPPSENTMNETA